MSRRAKGFKYLSGRCLEMRMLDETMTSSCRSLSSLASSSSDDPLLLSNRRSTVDENSHHLPLVYRQGTDAQSGIGGSADRVLMRKRPTPVKGGSRGMPTISWSAERRSVAELVKDCSKRFPVIVRVAQGYYGDGKLKLTVGQVLQIHGTCEERRIRATDAAGRRLSLPSSQLDHMVVEVIPPSPFNRSSPSKSVARTTPPGAMTLSEVLREKASSLPLTVAVTSIGSSSSSSSRGKMEEVEAQRTTDHTSISNFPLGTYLTIESYYDCTYLLANVIENGWLDSSSIVLIPDDLRPSFTVALGLKEGTAEEWKDFSGMFDRSARHIKFSSVKGYDGVIYDDWSEFSPTNPADEDELESGATNMVDIDRYLINKQLLVPNNNPDRSRINPDDLDHGRSGGQSGRFPRTSPRLSIHKRAVSNLHSSFALQPVAAISDTSVDSSSYVDSLGLITDALYPMPNASELLNHRGRRVDNTRDLSLEADCANVGRISRGPHNRPSNSRQMEVASRAIRQQNGDQTCKSDSVALAIDDITLEELAVGAPESKATSVANTADNKGTLISIDEGYNSGRFSVNAQTDVMSSASKRYSPVYF